MFMLNVDIHLWNDADKPILRDLNKFASSGNRTRAARVAGEHSTTEPTMLSMNQLLLLWFIMNRHTRINNENFNEFHNSS